MNFRIIFNPCVDQGTDTEFEQKFETLAEAKAALDAIANYTLHLHTVELMPNYSNFALIMEQVEPNCWEEVLEDE